MMAPQVPNRSKLMPYRIFVLAGPLMAWETLKISLYYETRHNTRISLRDPPCASDR